MLKQQNYQVVSLPTHICIRNLSQKQKIAVEYPVYNIIIYILQIIIIQCDKSLVSNLSWS